MSCILSDQYYKSKLFKNFYSRVYLYRFFWKLHIENIILLITWELNPRPLNISFGVVWGIQLIKTSHHL